MAYLSLGDQVFLILIKHRELHFCEVFPIRVVVSGPVSMASGESSRYISGIYLNHLDKACLFFVLKKNQNKTPKTTNQSLLWHKFHISLGEATYRGDVSLFK